MLNTLREKTQGLMGVALLIVLVIPFVLWGVSSYFGGSSTVYVARGQGLRISQAQFQTALVHQRAALERAYGKNLNPALLSGRKFKKAVLEGLINKTLLIKNAEAAGYVTNRTELAEEIRHIPAFRVKGRFSPSRYRTLLAAQGFTVPGFERRVRHLTLLDEVKAGLLASAFVPAPELTQAAQLLGQKRSVAYVILSPRQLAAEGPVSPAQVRAYYQAHPAAFQLPQKIRIAYVVLSPQGLLSTMHSRVSMAALQKAYQRHIQQYTEPAQRLVRHIMIALPAHPTAAQIARAKSRLATLRADIQKGASFGALAKRFSQDPASASQGGTLGFVTQAELSKPVGKAAFSLPLHQLSAPIVGKSGVHLLEVTAIRPAVVEPFAKVEGQLTRMVRERRARRRLYHLSERLRNAAFEHPHSLRPAAKKLGLPIHKSGWFTQAGGVGVAALPQVVKAVFAPKVLAGRRNTRAIPVGEDGLLVAHVIGHEAGRLEPLAAARPLIVKRIRAQLAQRQLKRRETLLMTELKKGAPLPVLAHQMHLVLMRPAPFEAGAPGLPKGLVAAVFRAPAPQKGFAVPGTATLSRGRQAVFVVQKVLMGSAKPGSGRFIRLERSFISDSGVQTYLAYMKSLRERAHIHIHESAL